MNPDEWVRIRAIFEELSALPREQREERLIALRLDAPLYDRLKKMLAADDRSDQLDAALQAEVQLVGQEIAVSRQPGQRVGPYLLTQRLGQGGMGEVFVAERVDGRFEAQVAIKFLVLAGARARALFERERQLLARVSHPNVARLIDAGEDGNSAYLVMEFVDGRRLTEYCAQEGVYLEDRLELLSQAALAVDYAHQHFVVHRDIKPAHLLVDREGALKVLDFGIAAMLDPQTGSANATASHSFTPLYAAPEQILGEPATTAVDVYALGLVLYELVTGRHPFGNATATTGDEAYTTERKLSGVASPIRRRGELCAFRDAMGGSRRWIRDLNAILQTALARRPQDRYRTPADLAADLRALAQGRAVLARAETRREAWLRWIRTHRVASGALGVAVISLVAGSVFALWSAQNAARQRDEALRQAQKAGMTAEFLQEVFRSVESSRSPDKEVSATDILDAGIKELDAKSQRLPVDLAAELRVVFGDMLLALGKYDDALAQHSRALELAEPLVLDHIVRKAQLGQGSTYNNLGNFSAAAAVLARLTAHPFRPQAFDEVDVRARFRLGYAYTQLGRFDEAEEVLDPMLANADRVLALERNGGELLGRLEMVRATLYGARGDQVNALKMHTLALSHLEAHFGTDLHQVVVSAIDNLSNAYADLGDDRQARAHSERSLALGARLYGELHPSLLSIRTSLASVLAAAGENDAGMDQIGAVLSALSKDEARPAYAWEGVAHHVLALLHENLRQFDEADSATREAIDVVTARYGEKSSRIGQYQASLGRVLWKRGLHDEARRYFLQGIDSLRKSVGEDHPELLQAEVDHLVFLADTGLCVECEALRTELHSRLLRKQPPEKDLLMMVEAFAPDPGTSRAQALAQLAGYPKLTRLGYVSEVAHRLAETSP